MRRVVRLKYIDASGRWPSGNPRLYFRYKGTRTPLPDAPENHPLFLEAYNAVFREYVDKSPAKLKGFDPGTIGALIVQYLSSETFRSLAENTRNVRRRALNKIQDDVGVGMMRDLRPVHIRRDIAKFEPHPAILRLKTWRAFCDWCYRRGEIETDPAAQVKRPVAPKTRGYAAFSREDFAAFREKWPLQTPQRLMFEVMYWTCAAVADACLLGAKNVTDAGWIEHTRQKSGSVAVCPLTAKTPAWAEAEQNYLIEALRLHDLLHKPRWIITATGKPRSPKAAASWFSNACTEANLPHLSGHGIRKGRAAIFRENGATLEQRLAWLGQETEEEGRHYSRSADLRRVIHSKP